MYCIKCGKELLTDTRFCSDCGAAVNTSAVNPKESKKPIGFLQILKESPGLLYCYGLQIFSLLVYCVFPIIGGDNGQAISHNTISLFSNSGLRSDGFAFAKFMAFVYVAVFLFALIRGVLNPRRIKSSALTELGASVAFGWIFREYISSQEIQYYRQRYYSWVTWGTGKIELQWGFYIAVVLLVIALLSAIFTKTDKRF